MVGKTQLVPSQNSLSFQFHPADVKQKRSVLLLLLEILKDFLETLCLIVRVGFAASERVIACLCNAILLWWFYIFSIVNNRHIEMFHFFTKCYTEPFFNRQPFFPPLLQRMKFVFTYPSASLVQKHPLLYVAPSNQLLPDPARVLTFFCGALISSKYSGLQSCLKPYVLCNARRCIRNILNSFAQS